VSAVEAALELVNMKEFMHRATHTLSGGQRQRVAIAGAYSETCAMDGQACQPSSISAAMGFSSQLCWLGAFVFSEIPMIRSC